LFRNLKTKDEKKTKETFTFCLNNLVRDEKPSGVNSITSSSLIALPLNSRSVPSIRWNAFHEEVSRKLR
jgi:hypothetical protein